MFGPLEAYGYVLNHGAILDYIPGATPDKYCPMIKNADGTEIQDKLVKIDIIKIQIEIRQFLDLRLFKLRLVLYLTE